MRSKTETLPAFWPSTVILEARRTRFTHDLHNIYMTFDTYMQLAFVWPQLESSIFGALCKNLYIFSTFLDWALHRRTSSSPCRSHKAATSVNILTRVDGWTLPRRFLRLPDGSCLLQPRRKFCGFVTQKVHKCGVKAQEVRLSWSDSARTCGCSCTSWHKIQYTICQICKIPTNSNRKSSSFLLLA